MSDASPPNPEAVRDALRALATGTAPTTTQTFNERIADATAATECAIDAATFLRANRLPELARAVADAESAGETTTAERGRRALETLRRLDSAAAELRGDHTEERW
ncbi:hypothetical protein C499_16612 [Halogeometricum borinquense DSM 11551]|uniref:Uncharacterized protein n=2 Tax=Halogeometricum borinquense TaxID=60847 RepID=E4NQX9_HALBP|nr:hypothetical protein [Halogeometricum borinquense]ADQ67926.1 hypothetical protein Hbor_23670 [Halogeometricum borinquense DSM 11551]ELY24154.1 hypothetical protein C499_16612 [Halogeometricum borinquense DSM 11551]RYJ13181.1 hypothetical protein ELS19_03795 [Halogeometricum borinquense]